MYTYMKERAVKCAEFIIATKSTCREAANEFGVSESTVHHDITKKLPEINPELYKQVRKVLDTNRAEARMRGGRKAQSNNYK